MALPHIPDHLAAAFDTYLDDERVPSMREVCLLAAALYALFGVLDVWAIPSALTTVWLIRASVIAILMGTLWLTWAPIFLRRYTLITVGTFFAMGLGIESMVYLAGPSDLARYLYYTGLILVVMALYTWSFLPIWMNATTGLVLVALYVLIVWGVHGARSANDWQTVVANCFFFISANVIGVFSNVQRARYLRHSFLARQELIDDLQRTETQRKQSEFWSEHDPLTDLPNRKHLMSMLDQAIIRTAKGQKLLALLFIDLDDFKPINDELGHAVGDVVLRIIGRRLARCVREGDLFARIGGDEFVVVVEVESGDREAAARLAQAIISSIESPIREPRIDQALSASVGIAFFPDHGTDAASLLIAADQQMYAAKHLGRGSVSVAAS